MIQQQILSLKIDSQKTFENFWVGETQQLIVEKLQRLQKAEALFLWGETAHGLTHLAQATCDYWQTQGKHTLYLDLNNIEPYQAILPQALEGFDLVIFDHLEKALTHQALEELIFHCFNWLHQHQNNMVFVAHQPPETLSCHLADLQSRLKSCLVLYLKPLSDEDKIPALIKHAEQQGLTLTQDVARYLINHYSRDLKDLLAVVAKLDRASLRDQKKLTIPFIKKILGNDYDSYNFE